MRIAIEEGEILYTMDEQLFDIIKNTLPTIITCIFTFLITRYKYNKNIPLDKLEIAYNRVYYPLFRLIKDNNDMDSVINKSRQYLDKYNKYVDRATIMALNTLVNSNTDAEKRKAYEKFEDNIYDKHSYLRRRLGYLEPKFFQMYTYMPSSQQLLFRIAFEFWIMCICIFLGILGIKILYEFAIKAVSVLIIILGIEIVCYIWRVKIWKTICSLLKFLYYKIKILYYKIRKY
ncbi:MAG: hypothetical protein HDT40_11900 [Lachnospiraceae bacterium]|nr:hypothetical protein [Lachnospiraceae bacterium]